jgi:hypothetical protein
MVILVPICPCDPARCLQEPRRRVNPTQVEAAVHAQWERETFPAEFPSELRPELLTP